MNYDSFKKQAALSLNLDALRQFRNAPKQVQDAWKSAPYIAGAAGTTAGLATGLAAGAGTYGLLSLIPGIKKKRGVKLLLSLLAGAGAGTATGIPAGRSGRDLYWKAETGLPSPWRTYLATAPQGSVSVTPADLKFDFDIKGHKGSFDIKAGGQDKLNMINDLLKDMKRNAGRWSLS